jgi:demethylmenaquinone methyltransferase / 2-methoxy-6-polyprenyl-1,4-benzoquinol methylase
MLAVTSSSPTPPTTSPTASNATAWSDTDLAANPHSRTDKPEKVRSMFAAIARSYDLNNRVHSLWQDQAWRRYAVRQAAPKPTETVLDVACGTGDLSEAFARAGAESVTGLDFTPEMLDIARHKASTRPQNWRADHIAYIQGDAQNLPFPDASFDVVSIAFGIRNVLDPARAVREFRRVLRPRGRVVILEFAEPSLAPIRWFNTLYCQRIMPITATWIAHDKSGAYKYLPKSVSTFMPPAQLCAMLTQAGFAEVTSTPLSLGICRCYKGVVPTA